MPPIVYIYLLTALDTLTGHLILVAYLMAVTDEQAVWRRLKRLPPLLLSPAVATLAASVLFADSEFNRSEEHTSELQSQR